MATEAIPGGALPNFDRLRLVRGHPRLFARRLPEIQVLRRFHYAENEQFSRDRDIDQRVAFAGTISMESWLDPTKGEHASPAQRHRHRQVVAAIDSETGFIAGFAYVTVGVSSKHELRLRKYPALRPLSIAVGALERTFKRWRQPQEKTYGYIREIVRRPDQPASLENVLGAGALFGYVEDGTNKARKGTIYPKTEQTALKGILRAWQYRHDGGMPQPAHYFGEDAPEAAEERWITDDIAVTANAMLETAGLQELPPIEQLTEML